MIDLAPQPEARFSIGDNVRVLDIHPLGMSEPRDFAAVKRGSLFTSLPNLTSQTPPRTVVPEERSIPTTLSLDLKIYGILVTLQVTA